MNTGIVGSVKKKLVVFYVGIQWENWDETNLTCGGIGGSETAVIWMARGLAKLGYEVKVFADPKVDHWDESLDDVEYIHCSKWESFSRSRFIDFFISSRTVSPFHIPFSAYRKYVWVHDIFLNPDRGFDCRALQVDAYLCLSDWHKQFFHNHHSIPLDKIKITANGVDPARYNEKVKKKPSQLFYSSSPDRGLDALLFCAEHIKKNVPDLSVVVSYGFSNFEKLVHQTNDLRGIKYVESLKKALDKPYIKYLGRIDQQALAKVQLESSGWFYPTNFDETFCITAVEAGFARVPILSSKKAGLISTIKDGGILLEGDSHSKEYLSRFIHEAVNLLTDQRYHDEWAERAYHRMKRFTWDAVAMQWHKMFQGQGFEEIQ